MQLKLTSLTNRLVSGVARPQHHSLPPFASPILAPSLHSGVERSPWEAREWRVTPPGRSLEGKQRGDGQQGTFCQHPRFTAEAAQLASTQVRCRPFSGGLPPPTSPGHPEGHSRASVFDDCAVKHADERLPLPDDIFSCDKEHKPTITRKCLKYRQQDAPYE